MTFELGIVHDRNSWSYLCNGTVRKSFSLAARILLFVFGKRNRRPHAVHRGPGAGSWDAEGILFTGCIFLFRIRTHIPNVFFCYS